MNQLFENAIIREKFAYNLYIKLIKKFPQSKELLQKIAEDELIHLNLFSKMNLDILKKVNLLSPLDIKISFQDLKSIKTNIGLINLAINEEEKAIEYYTFLQKYSSKEDNKIIIEIIKQENLHKETLINLKNKFM